MCPNHCAHVHETYMSELKITERPQYHDSREYTRSNRNRQLTKRINQQMGLHEIKNFFTTKEIICKIKTIPTEWEKNLCQLYKGQTTRIYRELHI
jgi:hypothetical protein